MPDISDRASAAGLLAEIHHHQSAHTPATPTRRAHTHRPGDESLDAAHPSGDS